VNTASNWTNAFEKHFKAFANMDHILSHFDKSNHKPFNVDPDFDRSFKDIVENNGFIFENHTVTTGDGYILALFRVTKEENKGKQPVFL
jgi:hypothetical protein